MTATARHGHMRLVMVVVLCSPLLFCSRIVGTWGHGEGRWSYLLLIRPAGCYQVNIPGERVRQDAAEQATSTLAGPGKRPRAASSTDKHPRPCLHALHHSRLFPCGPRCHRNILIWAPVKHSSSVCGSRVRPNGDCITTTIFMPCANAADAGYATTVVCGVLSSALRGRLFNLTYGGLILADASQRAAFAVCSKWRAASACHLPHSFDAASQRDTDLLGRLRRLFCAPVIRRLAQPVCTGPDAISNGSSGDAEGCQPSKPSNATTPEGSRPAPSMATDVSTSETSGR